MGAFEQSFARGVAEERAGNLDAASDFFALAFEESGKTSFQALFKLGCALLKRGMRAEALKCLIKCHQQDFCRRDLEPLILDVFHKPLRPSFRAQYEKNVGLLAKYPFIRRREFRRFDELNWRFLPFSPNHFVIFDSDKKTFLGEFDKTLSGDGLTFTLEQFEKGVLSMAKAASSVMITNIFREDVFAATAKKTFDPDIPLAWMQSPIYVAFGDAGRFEEHLQVMDLSGLLDGERFVFQFGAGEIRDWMLEPGAQSPSVLSGSLFEGRSLTGILEEIALEKNRITYRDEAQVHDHYRTFSIRDLPEKIRSGKARIGFLTSRFTTMLQYSIRDCGTACERLGIPHRIMIEDHNLNRITEAGLAKFFREFQPELFLVIDHFRWEYPVIPPEIPYITWIQDPMDSIMDPQSAKRVGDRDFLLSIYYSGREFSGIGYPKDRLIDYPMPVNDELYKTYSLSDQEISNFRADVCVFSHLGNPEIGFQGFIREFEKVDNRAMLEKILSKLYSTVLVAGREGRFFYSIDEYCNLIEGTLKDFGMGLRRDLVEKVASLFRIEAGFRISRSVPVEWLAEKGYDLALYGREWPGHPIVGRFARGVAQNGEPLSRILNACKIVVGNNPGMTSHARVFEAFLSNALYIGTNIPAEHDWANIREFLTEGKEILFFYDRKDLYDKIDYYLSHENERLEIVERAKKKILATFTYKGMIKKLLDELALRIELKFP